MRERRLALVVGTKGIQDEHGLLWVMMNTSSENRGWANDVPVSDLSKSGLPSPSVVRTAKIATIVIRETERIGILPSMDRKAVMAHVSQILSGLD